MFGKTKKNYGSCQGKHDFYFSIIIFLIVFSSLFKAAYACDNSHGVYIESEFITKWTSLNPGAEFLGTYDFNAGHAIIQAKQQATGGRGPYVQDNYQVNGVMVDMIWYGDTGYPSYKKFFVICPFDDQCEIKPDSDGDGISDKDDLDFIETADKSLGGDSNDQNASCN